MSSSGPGREDGESAVQMSRYNPFAKPKARPLPGVQSAPEITTTVSDKREDVDSATVSGRNPFGTRNPRDGASKIEAPLNEERSKTTPNDSHALGQTAEFIKGETSPIQPIPQPRTATIAPGEHVLLPKITTPFDPQPPPTIRSTLTHPSTHIQPPPPTSQSVSRWRLLWRGGLEVGSQRYKLEGIAFCAKMTFSVPALARKDSMESPTGKTKSGVTDGTPVGSVNAMLDKEMTMREEGSYFPHTATEGLPSDATTPLPAITPTGSTPRTRRPVLNTQSSVQDGPVPFHTPGGSVTGKAFETSDPDLCLSLESMKGRQTLRVRGVERLRDDEVLGQDGESGVHV